MPVGQFLLHDCVRLRRGIASPIDRYGLTASTVFNGHLPNSGYLYVAGHRHRMLAIADAVMRARSVPFYLRWVVLAALTLIGAVAMLKVARRACQLLDFGHLYIHRSASPRPGSRYDHRVARSAHDRFLSREQRRPLRITFNIAAVGLAMWLAGALAGRQQGHAGPAVPAISTGGWRSR